MAERHETEHTSFGTPDETRAFRSGRAEILNLGGREVGRLVFEPGWRWSNDVKPIAKTESCEAPHVTSRPSGHDAWVIGEEPVVVHWRATSNYANGG